MKSVLQWLSVIACSCASKGRDFLNSGKNYDRLDLNRKLPVVEQLVDLLLILVEEYLHQHNVAKSSRVQDCFREILKQSTSARLQFYSQAIDKFSATAIKDNTSHL